jgi:hypothetical protein
VENLKSNLKHLLSLSWLSPGLTSFQVPCTWLPSHPRSAHLLPPRPPTGAVPFSMLLLRHILLTGLQPSWCQSNLGKDDSQPSQIYSFKPWSNSGFHSPAKNILNLPKERGDLIEDFKIMLGIHSMNSPISICEFIFSWDPEMVTLLYNEYIFYYLHLDSQLLRRSRLEGLWFEFSMGKKLTKAHFNQ